MGIINNLINFKEIKKKISLTWVIAFNRDKKSSVVVKIEDNVMLFKS